MKYVKKWRKSVYLIWCFVLLFSAIVPYGNQTANAEQGGTGSRVVKIAGGRYHSLALKADGTVVAWGSNAYGQTDVPSGLSDVVAIAAGGYHSLALKADGTVVAWGYNDYGQTDVPSGLSDVVAIAAGMYHSLALKADGTVVAWGDNSYGQTDVPSGLSDVVAITAGGLHSLALKADGTVVAWGDNTYGQTDVPSDLSNVVAIAAGGFHSLALKADGSVVGWGYNDYEQTDVPSDLSNVVAIAAGGFHSLALKADGSVVGWGSNAYSQTDVSDLSDVVAIAAGEYHSLALKADGTVVALGHNTYEQTSVPEGITAPVKGIDISDGAIHSLALKADGSVVVWGSNPSGQTDVPSGLSDVVAIAAGGLHSLALKADGTVVGWGENGFGQTDVPSDLSDVVAIAAGGFHSLALKADGTVVAWGRNVYGQIDVPSDLSDVVAIAAGEYHSLALKADGSVVGWGWNEYGQTDVPSGLSDVVAVAAGMYHSLALKADGTVVAWGRNNYEQIDVPSDLSDVVAIAAGGEHSLALKADGTVVAWGRNNYEQTDVPSDLSDVVAIAAGMYHSLALKANGTVAAWGLKDFGQTDVPGSEQLSDLSIQEGDFTPVFSSEDTAYTYQYVGPSISELHVTATLADAEYAALYINGQLQTSGSPVAIDVTESTTDIEVRVEPYLKQGKTYTIALLRDDTPPVVDFDTDGNTLPSKMVETIVTVSDGESGVDAGSLQYAWSQSTDVPTSGWTAFASGDTLKMESGDGNWYLHVRAQDSVGNTTNAVSNVFVLDNTDPVITLNGNNPMNIPQDGTYMEPGASAWDAIDGDLSSSIVITGDVDTTKIGNYLVSYAVTDHAGNTASVTRSVYVYDGDAPAIYLNGANPMTVEVGSVFIDPGATASDKQDGDLTDHIVVTGYVDTSTVGTYTLSYDVSDSSGNAAATVTRTVYVEDTEPPVLVLLGDSEMSVSYGETFIDPGAQAVDDYEGDLTDHIVVTGYVDTSTLGTYTLSYDVSDSAGNAAATVTRTVHVEDTEPPVLVLLGDPEMSVSYGETFIDPGAQAVDDYEGDLTDHIVVTGYVDASTVGTYTLSYDVSDSSGNAAATMTRTVYVEDTEPPVLVLLGDPEMSVSYGETFIDPGAQATDDYYGDVSDRIVVTGSVDTSQAGDYILRYNVDDPAGNAAAEVTRTVTVLPASTSSSKKSSKHSEDTSSEWYIDVNGNIVDASTIDTAKSSVTLEAESTDGTAYMLIPVPVLTDFAEKNADFMMEFKTAYGSFHVPAGLASFIPDFADSLEEHQLDAEDVAFKIVLTDKSGDGDIQEALARNMPNGQVMGEIVDFQVEIVNVLTGETIGTADEFTEGITRMIPMSDQWSEMPQMWGAFRYNETTGKFEFVPARSVKIDGAWQVALTSYTNSVYVVLDHPVSFTDTEKHWGQPYIELAAAKGIVEGVGGSRYAPDETVTRAEFAAMLVRVLGRGTSTDLPAPYDDVKPVAWYFDEVATAKDLGLLDALSGTEFKPNRSLTREEMASMLAAVIDLEERSNANDVDLNRYKDIGSVNESYLEGIRTVVGLQIMVGTGQDEFTPQGETTRAQAAVVLIQTLRMLGWIDAE